MYISKIVITQLRNLQAVELEPSTQFNLLVGSNGAGKTSFLEAVYLLSVGRSFRSQYSKPIINHESAQMTVTGITNDGVLLGIEKSRDGKTRIRINREPCRDVASLASILPLQIINPDSYKILEAGPQFRRRFLDWGVFHVKHQFFDCWKKVRHILQQRNAALRQRYTKQQIEFWDREFLQAAELLHQMRQQYISHLQPIFKSLVSSLLNEDIALEYYRGWKAETSLDNVLEQAHERDKHLGYTQFGPQRADISFSVNQRPAVQVLSRGQQKLLICSLKIAQGVLLQQQSNKTCVFLIDDLTSELDAERTQKVMKLLSGLKSQVFITSIEDKIFHTLDMNESNKLFHVKHGGISHSTSK